MEDEDVSASLREAYQQTTTETNAIAALQASRGLYRELSAWQTTLVAKALHEGATWEDVGSALGATRQAAWARFRNMVEPLSLALDDLHESRRQAMEEINAAQDKLAARELVWRQERTEIQTQFRTLQQRLRVLGKEAAAERAALREDITRLRDSLRTSKRSPQPTG